MTIDNKVLKQLLKKVDKPGRYTGGELGEVVKPKKEGEVSIAFCFPDSYEIGMSNLGIKILYGALNNEDFVRCERCFAPWVDMEQQLRENNVPLFTLESKTPLSEFDIVAFSLQYELSYTNVLNMLNLAGIPLFAKDRNEDHPIIIAGGPSTYNPEPMADFFDVFSIGEGEYSLPALAKLFKECRDNGQTKKEFLEKVVTVEGMYVPSLYEVDYNTAGSLKSFTPVGNAPTKVKKAIVKDLDNAYFPDKPIVPYLSTVHDRIMLEIFRGCIRGCRFCQAGIVYRPYREKSADKLNAIAADCVNNTGYNEIALLSLSISDYSQLNELTENLLDWTDKEKVSLSLPSMRVDSFYKELMEKVMSVRQSGITFAPEAGSQRLRDVINKNISEEDILSACDIAYEGGKDSIKLYFMNGLPTETDEDIKAIAVLAKKLVDKYFSSPHRRKGRSISITVSVSCFVPKPLTPFQWFGQNTIEELVRKQKLLTASLESRRISHKWHEAKVSKLEAVFSRGDRRLSAAIATAFNMGMRFDSWDEFFSYEKWCEAFEKCNIDPSFYSDRTIPFDEILPWDHIDCGVSKEFLIKEAKKAISGETTPDCRTKCSGCGANNLGGERSCCP